MGTRKQLAYVTNSYGDSISVIDTAINEVIDTIAFDQGTPTPVPHWTGEVISSEGVEDAEGNEMVDFSGVEHLMLTNTPMNPRFSPDGSKLYVPCPVGRNISIVNPTTNTIVERIDFDMQPNDIRWTPDGSKIVVSLLGETPRKPGAVAFVDAATHKVGEPIQIGTQPEELELSADGSKAYLVSKALWVLDVNTEEVINEVYLPYWCYDSLLSPDGKRLFLTSTFGENKIVVVDTETDSVAGSIDVHMPASVAFTADQKRMLVTNCYVASVQVVDLDTDQVIAEATVPDYPSVIMPNLDRSRAYITHSVSNLVSVLDMETYDVVETIEVGVGPCAVAIGEVEVS